MKPGMLQSMELQRLSGHELGQTPADDEGQGSLECCSPWGPEESDMTHQLMVSVKGVSLPTLD